MVRRELKAFSQRSPDGRGGWIEGKGAMRGVRIVPYRPPELIAADVVVLPDNDKPGHDHAQKVAANLSPVTKRMRVVALPGPDVGDDIVNWLDAGGTPAELMRLADETSIWKADPPNPSLSREKDPEAKDSRSTGREKQADAIIKVALEEADLAVAAWLLLLLEPVLPGIDPAAAVKEWRVYVYWAAVVLLVLFVARLIDRLAAIALQWRWQRRRRGNCRLCPGHSRHW